MHPKIIRIDPVDATTNMVPLDTSKNLSNIFLYIPPPLNIFIYYSANNHTISEEDKSTSNKQNDRQNKKINETANFYDVAVRNLSFETDEKINEQSKNSTSSRKSNIDGFVEWLQRKGHKVPNELV